MSSSHVLTLKGNMYQVKFEVDGETRYGIIDQYSEDAKALPEDSFLIEDAITPETYVINKDDLTEISLDEYPNEFSKYVEAQREAAYEASRKLTKFSIGKVFSVPVGDGRAYYKVTDVTSTKAAIEWRGFAEDRWIAPYFGWGGVFDKKHIIDLARSEERLNRLFSSTKVGG